MRPLRYGQAWLITGLVLLVLGIVAALSSSTPGLPVTNGDKILHGLAFFAFMIWFGGIFQAIYAPFLVIGLSGYGLLIEVLQRFTPTRQADVFDLVADVAGILLGWLLSSAGLSRWCAKLESWFVHPTP